MKNHLDHHEEGDSLEDAVTTAATAEEIHIHRVKAVPVSPLSWSIRGRLLAAAAASALLWLAVAWAIGRLS